MTETHKHTITCDVGEDCKEQEITGEGYEVGDKWGSLSLWLPNQEEGGRKNARINICPEDFPKAKKFVEELTGEPLEEFIEEMEE